MKYIFSTITAFLYLIICSNFAFAQVTDEQILEEDSSNWEVKWITSLNGTQAAYSNWSQGGVSSLSVIGSSVSSAKYSADKNQFKSTLNLRYGQTKVEDEDFRKSADEIRWRNQYLRKFEDERWGAFFNLNLDTQFDEGFDKDTGVRNSDFFAPGYITQILGISYRPDEYFTTEAGLSSRQTFVRHTELATRYGLEEGENFRNEFGFSLLISYEREIFTNIVYSGLFESFTNPQESISKSEFLFSNVLTGKITDNISANFELAFRYNEDFIDEIQTKQILSVGISYVFR